MTMADAIRDLQRRVIALERQVRQGQAAAAASPPAPRRARLSETELAICHLLAGSYTIRAAAGVVGLTPNTTKKYAIGIYRKLGITGGRVELAVTVSADINLSRAARDACEVHKSNTRGAKGRLPALAAAPHLCQDSFAGSRDSGTPAEPVVNDPVGER